VPRLSLVIPHWSLNEETNEALQRCVSSFPAFVVTPSEHVPRIQEAQASAYHALRELVG